MRHRFHHRFQHLAFSAKKCDSTLEAKLNCPAHWPQVGTPFSSVFSPSLQPDSITRFLTERPDVCSLQSLASRETAGLLTDHCNSYSLPKRLDVFAPNFLIHFYFLLSLRYDDFCIFPNLIRTAKALRMAIRCRLWKTSTSFSNFQMLLLIFNPA